MQICCCTSQNVFTFSYLIVLLAYVSTHLFIFLNCCTESTIFSSGNTQWHPTCILSSSARPVLKLHPKPHLTVPQKGLQNSAWLAGFACHNTGSTNCNWITELSTCCCQRKPIVLHAKMIIHTTPKSYFPGLLQYQNSLITSSPFSIILRASPQKRWAAPLQLCSNC